MCRAITRTALYCVISSAALVQLSAPLVFAQTDAATPDSDVTPEQRSQILQSLKNVFKDVGLASTSAAAPAASGPLAAASSTAGVPARIIVKFNPNLPVIAEAMSLGSVPQDVMQDLTLSAAEMSDAGRYKEALQGFFSVESKHLTKLQKLKDLGFIEGFSAARKFQPHGVDPLYPFEPGVETAANFSDTSYVQLNNDVYSVPFSASADIDINASQMWAQRADTGNVVVAVIDSGTDKSLPDLQPNLWTNPAEIPGNGIDDDGNGVIDDVNGAAFDAGGGYGAPTGNISPRSSHGTEVAGVLAARRGNSAGMAGVAASTKLVTVVVGGEDGYSMEAIIRGLQYLVDLRKRYMDSDPNNGGANIRVVNMSFGGAGDCNNPQNTDLQALKSLIYDANYYGMLVVASAGNDNSNNDVSPISPSGCNVPNVISVGASDHQGRRACFYDWVDQSLGHPRCTVSIGSNYGSHSVHLTAPGHFVLSTLPMSMSSTNLVRYQEANGAPYAYVSGTSFSAPIVAGVSAIMFAQNWALSPVSIKSILMGTVRQKSDLVGKFISPGIVDGSKALQTAGNLSLNSWRNANDPYDTDGNGVEDGRDVTSFYYFLEWIGNGNPWSINRTLDKVPGPAPYSDVNGDRTVNFNDLIAVADKLETAGKVVSKSYTTTVWSNANFNVGKNFVRVNFPSGVSYDASTGYIRWTPTAQQQGDFVARLANATGILKMQIHVYPAAPTITSNPQSQTVTVGSTVKFGVSTAGNGAPHYQWRKNGVNVGTDSSNYTFTAKASDNGTTYNCVVTNGYGSATSSTATLTVH